jgi:hypothetical protein
MEQRSVNRTVDDVSVNYVISFFSGKLTKTRTREIEPLKADITDRISGGQRVKYFAPAENCP